MMNRPRIAILGRFTESASALRYRELVSSRALLEYVWAGGGDPMTLLPGSDVDALDWATRLRGFERVLLPGGGDIRPTRYGKADDDPSLYDMDEMQDESDITLTRYCLAQGIPMLAVCRGMHVLNTVRGGTLIVDMPENHRHRVHEVALTEGAGQMGISHGSLVASCYLHQAIERVGDGLTVVGTAADGVIEAVVADANAWTVGVQWHPEDTYEQDEQQRELVRTLVCEAGRR
jgi:putative glutamine amidotransferase